MGPFASELFSNFGSINTHTYIYPVSEKLTSSPKPVGLETVYFGLNFIITIWLLIIIHYHSLFEKNWYLLSHWPIKLQHELFSPRKVHVRMHKSLVYELNLIAGVSSPSTWNNIIDPGWGEYAVDNYQIASERQL